jgi:pimeloyl-ACP methyl ester carboxylesterase
MHPMAELALAILATLAVVFLVWGILVAFFSVDVPRPPERHPDPTTTTDEALARLKELKARDTVAYNEVCHTALLEPDGAASATIVYFHGFTNCPNQFVQGAAELSRRGYRVLMPRQPHMGLKDVLTHDLHSLTPIEITELADTTIDIAAGFGDPVYVIGLSTGGLVAAWTATTREEVVRLVTSAPVVTPKGVPMPLVRLAVRFPRLLPPIYIWWDSKKKDKLGESPYVYPGFPLRSIFRFMLFGVLMSSRIARPGHTLERVAVTTNVNDSAVSIDEGRWFACRTFEGHTRQLVDEQIDAKLGWGHDFVDPSGPAHGSPAQVADVFLAGLGLTQDETAGGLVKMVPLGSTA